MGAKFSVYRMPLIDRAWKVNINVKQRHWFEWPWFNWGWIFKDYLALEPKILEHRTSLIFWQKIMKIPDLAILEIILDKWGDQETFQSWSWKWNCLGWRSKVFFYFDLELLEWWLKVIFYFDNLELLMSIKGPPLLRSG